MFRSTKEKAYRKTNLLIASAVTLLLFISVPQLSAQDLDVPYVPTPQNVVESMLDLADVNSSDYVIDLGSGDGRIVITAAKRGANGHGVDLDPQRIKEARNNAEREGVSDQIMFIEGDLFETDFSEASVITMYLLSSVNRKLRPELLDKLQPGTRIVSHSFDMGSWEPDKEEMVQNDNGIGSNQIYYWVIPAKVEGTWSWTADNMNFDLEVNQEFQKIDATLSDGNGNNYEIKKAEVRGERISLEAGNGNNSYIFSGRVENDEIKGTMQIHEGMDKSFSLWNATKK